MRNIGIFAHVDAGKTTLTEQLLLKAAQIRRRLTEKAALLSEPDKLLEAACDADDGLMERYLAEGGIPEGEIFSRLPGLAKKGALFPVLTGSALRGQGIEAVLDGILRYLPPPDTAERTLCGVAFAAEYDRLLGKGLWIRLYGGQLENREAVTLPGRLDPVTGETGTVQYKITQITGGRGGMRMKLHGYRECPPGLGAAAPRRGVDPLDTSKYILAARSALEGGIFDL